MTPLKKISAHLASLALLTGGLSLAVTQPAAAGDFGCPGSLVGTHNISDSQNIVWGTLYVYYSSTNGGTNCMVNKAVRYYGTSHTIRAFISGAGKSDNDTGKYKYYAGPVSVSGINDRCITIAGQFVNPQGTQMESREWNNVHCG